MNILIGCAVGMKRQLRFTEGDMRRDFTAHAPALLEYAVSPPKRKTPSTPSPQPNARISLPPPARSSAQKARSPLNSRLYRLTVRSRAKSLAADLFSSVNP